MLPPACTVSRRCTDSCMSCFPRRWWASWGCLLSSASSPAPRLAQHQALSRASGNTCWKKESVSSKKPSPCGEEDSEGCHGNQMGITAALLRHSPHSVPHKKSRSGLSAAGRNPAAGHRCVSRFSAPERPTSALGNQFWVSGLQHCERISSVLWSPQVCSHREHLLSLSSPQHRAWGQLLSCTLRGSHSSPHLIDKTPTVT